MVRDRPLFVYYVEALLCAVKGVTIVETLFSFLLTGIVPKSWGQHNP